MRPFFAKVPVKDSCTASSCASVTVEQYQELTAKEAEFLCPTCCRAKQQLEINNLSGEVTALKLELAQLKEAVTILSQKQKQAETTVEDTWTTVNHEGGQDRQNTLPLEWPRKLVMPRSTGETALAPCHFLLRMN